MITVRKSQERGAVDHGWLDTKHTFSFSSYHDPGHMGFRTLRVINEDRIAGGEGFGAHPHRDMEIVTYVISGALEHRDSLGSGGVLYRGDVQAMSAGTGITHSEFNHSPDEPVHLIQTWILPAERRTPPRYDQKRFDDEEKRNRLTPIASGRNAPGALQIGQDATIFAALLDAGKEVVHRLADGRGAWLQLITGALSVNGSPLAAGDGAAIENEAELSVAAESDSEFLLFDLA